MTNKTYEQFTKVSYSGRELLKKHTLNEQGLWKIRGEDDNADFGGSHYMPELGIVEGKLKDVINYAVGIPRFWTWGGGGDITKINTPIKITAESNAKRVAAEQKIAELKEQLKHARNELKGL